ncbi:MAG TPA: hypothetical protein VMU24_02385 [Candidatus Acidoferrales bacterium]|nr:hypothetical protein [Candidatus Acidoferrales bacterium]
MLEVMPKTETERTAANPFGGGMDWLEVRLPEDVSFRPEVRDIIHDDAKKHRASEHYSAVIDLRKYDVADAMLHFAKRRGEHTHKLQLIGTGQSSFRQNVSDISNVVDCNPMRLQPMRTDLTVDVRDVPMSWVHSHVKAKNKQFAASVSPDITPKEHSHDKETLLAMGTRGVQTLYIGKRPNCFRFYDKTAERLNAFRKFTRGWHPTMPTMKRWLRDITAKEQGAEFLEFERYCMERGLNPDHELDAAWYQRTLPENEKILRRLQADIARKVLKIGPKPTFEDFCGLHEGDVITRFERMIGAQEVKRIHLLGDPREIPLFSSLNELRANVADFNPFEPIDFVEAGSPEPSLPEFSNGKYSLWDYAAGMFFRERIMTEGMQAVESRLKPHAKGHWDDGVMRRLRDFGFLPPDGSAAQKVLDEASLYERYRDAVQKQLAA